MANSAWQSSPWVFDCWMLMLSSVVFIWSKYPCTWAWHQAKSDEMTQSSYYMIYTLFCAVGMVKCLVFPLQLLSDFYFLKHCAYFILFSCLVLSASFELGPLHKSRHLSPITKALVEWSDLFIIEHILDLRGIAIGIVPFKAESRLWSSALIENEYFYQKQFTNCAIR